MSLTTAIKSEILASPLVNLNQRKAQTVCLLRFAGGIHLVSRHIVVEAEVDSEAVMECLVSDCMELYRTQANVIKVSAAGIRRDDSYVVRVVEGANQLARLTGLIDRLGRPVRGLPPAIVSAGKGEALAAWRGAFLARGSLSHPGRSTSLEVTCPGPEAALALVGAARRLGITVKAREVRGANRVVIRDGEMIAKMLQQLGAVESLKQWQEQREKRETRSAVNRLANFDDANLRRSVQAAVMATARVKRAFEILGADIPPHLRQAGELRLEYRAASLEELGQRAEPPLTKDAVAGRIRRLLQMADKVAKEKGIDDTHIDLPDDGF